MSDVLFPAWHGLVALLAFVGANPLSPANVPQEAQARDVPSARPTRISDGTSPELALPDALARLRALGFGGAAHALARRTTQRHPKMRLTSREGVAAAHALVALADVDGVRALHAVMPRSTLELARATDERQLPVAEATSIARYLVRVVAALGFRRLDAFDESHSHVIGRHWHDIDYSGEGMTWQRQRDHWAARGVADFRTASSIHAYFVGAERLRHWQRVYRPRGRMAEVVAPARPR